MASCREKGCDLAFLFCSEKQTQAGADCVSQPALTCRHAAECALEQNPDEQTGVLLPGAYLRALTLLPAPFSVLSCVHLFLLFGGAKDRTKGLEHVK